MNTPIDSEKTIEIIERMKFAKIGKYKKWELLIKKIKNNYNENGLNCAARPRYDHSNTPDRSFPQGLAVF